jgi:hypothetical protein
MLSSWGGVFSYGGFFSMSAISSGRDDWLFIKFRCCERGLLWQEKLQGFFVYSFCLS